MSFTPKFVDLVRNFTTTTGTGNFVLGAAVTGYTSFASAMQVGESFYYSAIGVDKPAEREVGRGTLQPNGTISRDPISGAPTNFTTGTKTLSLIAAAEWFNVVQAGAGASTGGGAVATRAELAAANPAQPTLLTEVGREGNFVWSGANLSAQVTADPRQGVYVAPASAPTGASGAWVRKFTGPLQIEWFGALGDGATNDTLAFAGAASVMALSNGATLRLEKNKTYIVGQQTLGGDPVNWNHAPANILNFGAFTGHIRIEGNGATMKAAAGLYFGSFTPGTNTVFNPPGVFVDKTYLSSPYQGMIHAEGATGTLEVENLALDGNIQNAVIGGTWGDTGWQVKNAGLQLRSVKKVILRNVVSKNHGTDGMTYDAIIADEKAAPIPFSATGCKFDSNGRLGVAVVSGRGLAFTQCEFTKTGKNGVVSSAPNAGLDLEAETGLIRDVEFDLCEFSDNTGAGLVADTGDTANVILRQCKLIGTTAASAWLKKPGFKVYDSLFVGKVLQVYGDAIPERAAQFYRCRFLDDPLFSPTGASYIDTVGFPILEFSTYANQYFEDCYFKLINNARVPNPGDISVRFNDCRIDQDTAYGASMVATFSGSRTVLESAGVLSLGASAFEDDFVYQGTPSHGDRKLANLSVDGRVGIGVVAPDPFYFLRVRSNSHFAAYLTTSTATGFGNPAVAIASENTGVQGHLTPTATGFAFGTFGAHDIEFYRNNAQVAAFTATGLTASGAIASSGGKVGYDLGAGGTVSQTTSKSTGVTLNKLCGQITMAAGALAANTTVSFTLTNSFIAPGDLLILNHVSGGTAGAYALNAQCAAGTAAINVRNHTAASLSEAIVIGFAIQKAVTA